MQPDSAYTERIRALSFVCKEVLFSPSVGSVIHKLYLCLALSRNKVCGHLGKVQSILKACNDITVQTFLLRCPSLVLNVQLTVSGSLPFGRVFVVEKALCLLIQFISVSFSYVTPTYSLKLSYADLISLHDDGSISL